jgi:hypothetical protein
MLTFKVAELLRTFWLPSFVFVALCSRCWDDHMYQCFFLKTTFVLETHSFVAMVKQMRSKEIRRPPILVRALFYLEHTLETRARHPLWRFAEALGNTGDFCTKISTFGSSTPLDIYK